MFLVLLSVFANSISGLSMRIQVRESWVSPVEEPGEQCTVVFALLVTEPAGECVCGGGGVLHPLPPTSQFGNSLCKDDSAFCSPDFSMVLVFLTLFARTCIELLIPQ
jgi:hypothetical protein